jgi:hypothetical protein
MEENFYVILIYEETAMYDKGLSEELDKALGPAMELDYRPSDKGFLRRLLSMAADGHVESANFGARFASPAAGENCPAVPNPYVSIPENSGQGRQGSTPQPHDRRVPDAFRSAPKP